MPVVSCVCGSLNFKSAACEKKWHSYSHQKVHAANFSKSCVCFSFVIFTLLINKYMWPSKTWELVWDSISGQYLQSLHQMEAPVFCTHTTHTHKPPSLLQGTRKAWRIIFFLLPAKWGVGALCDFIPLQTGERWDAGLMLTAVSGPCCFLQRNGSLQLRCKNVAAGGKPLKAKTLPGFF